MENTKTETNKADIYNIATITYERYVTFNCRVTLPGGY